VYNAGADNRQETSSSNRCHCYPHIELLHADKFLRNLVANRAVKKREFIGVFLRYNTDIAQRSPRLNY
jgi:hypothetical protein